MGCKEITTKRTLLLLVKTRAQKMQLNENVQMMAFSISFSAKVTPGKQKENSTARGAFS
jgi:hypothetical protein